MMRCILTVASHRASTPPSVRRTTRTSATCRSRHDPGRPADEPDPVHEPGPLTGAPRDAHPRLQLDHGGPADAGGDEGRSDTLRREGVSALCSREPTCYAP